MTSPLHMTPPEGVRLGACGGWDAYQALAKATFCAGPVIPFILSAAATVRASSAAASGPKGFVGGVNTILSAVA